MRRWGQFVWVGILWVLVGCGGPNVAPVRGKITLNGKPIGPGDILFVPDETKGTQGKAAVGSFEADGLYSLTTYKKDDGALVGHHHVIVRPRPPGVAPGREFAKDAQLPPIPAKYADLSNPLLSAEVKPGSQEINFNLTP